MFRLLNIDHVVLRVSNLAVMQHFYCEVLGCTLEREEVDQGLTQLRAGASLIDLVPVSGKLGARDGAAPSKGGKNMDHFCLAVEPFDAEALARHFRRHGVTCGEVSSRYGAQGRGPSMYVSDPEGNTVEIKGPPWRAEDESQTVP